MADEDVYSNKKTYLAFMDRLETLAILPNEAQYKRKYWCKNKENLKYFKKLEVNVFEVKDTSYIGRNKTKNALIFITHHTEKDLKDIDSQEEINMIVAESNKVNNPSSHAAFKKQIKFIWKELFPVTEIVKGKEVPDRSVYPYQVKHLSSKVDVSKGREPRDKTTKEVILRVIGFFANDPRMQAFLSMIYYSFTRPQELLYTRIKDINDFGTYAIINIASHGKEGTKIIEVFDAYPYLVDWLNCHPDKYNGDAYIFCSYRNKNQKVKK